MKKTIRYVLSPKQEGLTVGTLLRQQEFSTGMIRRLKQTNGIFLDDRPVTVRCIAHAGQTLSVTLPPKPAAARPVALPLAVVYEDDCLLVVNKPSGMPVHPSAGHHEDTLANAVAYYAGERFGFHPVTRLDRYTSGLTLCAKDAHTAALLCRRMQEGKIRKIYHAVVEGTPEPPAGTVDLPIARLPGSVLARRVDPAGKPAVTRYTVLSSDGAKSLVQAEPVTGRTHQIRVHMAAIGHPLCDDFLYGTQKGDHTFRLCCVRLAFEHPVTGQPFSAEISVEFPDFH